MNTGKKAGDSLRWLLLGMAIIFSLGLSPMRRSASVEAVSPSVVISQVYGGGGANGDPVQTDFVELFNRGNNPVSLDGWSIQYAAATGSGNFGGTASQLTLLSGTLNPGKYLLIQEALGSSSAGLPQADLRDETPIEITAERGKVALVDQSSSLACNGGSKACSAEMLAHVVDRIGYGEANFYEGPAPAVGGSRATALFRNLNGCQDGDDNRADFLSGAPLPRNNTLPVVSCPMQVSGLASPASIAAGASSLLTVSVAPGSNPPSHAVTVQADLSAMGGALDQEFSDSGSDGDLQAGDWVFSHQLQAAVDAPVGAFSIPVTIRDAEARVQSAAIEMKIEPPRLSIHDIQGRSHVSPYQGRQVLISGIVTGVRSIGFYLQEPQPDGDLATSEGIFVYTVQQPSIYVGDRLTVKGFVAEYRPDGTEGNSWLSLTEITSPVLEVEAHAQPLPAAVTLGTGGRIPPDRVYKNTAGDVDGNSDFLPVSNGLDFFESLEGMRVQVNGAVAIGPLDQEGMIPVVGDMGLNASQRTARGGLVVSEDDLNPERIFLDDEVLKAASPAGKMPGAQVGDSFSQALVGVMDYTQGLFTVELNEPPVLIPGLLTPETASPAVRHQLSIATLNVNNLSATDSSSRFQKFAQQVVIHLQSPDLLVVEEVQDDNGTVNDGVVSAERTCEQMAAAVQSLGGPVYAYRQINPQSGQDGGQPGGNIRSVFFFRVDRGLTFLNEMEGTSQAANIVQTDSAGHVSLKYNPGRIDPANPAFQDSRKPLTGVFSFNGQDIFVIANHFNSKLGDQPLYGRYQPPALSSETQRIRQAGVVHDFVQQILAVDPHANVVVLGDLNDFQFSTAVKTLEGAPQILYDRIETLPVRERYTYVYQGNAQALDHILISPELLRRPSTLDVVHVNAEFINPLSDHDPQVLTLDFNSAPRLDQSPEDISLVRGQAFHFQLSADLFVDQDSSDLLQYSAKLENGENLPDWLQFDPQTRTFFGTCPEIEQDELWVQLIATDPSGASASVLFRLHFQDGFRIFLPTLAR
jgi:predicted extracellular nuclease